mmetsp:Transcript_6475/g.11251  ORF Transcript_6475/g.11251 Transcript_6475/m.11251 type:complete len:225 (-) Transcript_6475:2664-3338(-)
MSRCIVLEYHKHQQLHDILCLLLHTFQLDKHQICHYKHQDYHIHQVVHDKYDLLDVNHQQDTCDQHHRNTLPNHSRQSTHDTNCRSAAPYQSDIVCAHHHTLRQCRTRQGTHDTRRLAPAQRRLDTCHSRRRTFLRHHIDPMPRDTPLRCCPACEYTSSCRLCLTHICQLCMDFCRYNRRRFDIHTQKDHYIHPMQYTYQDQYKHHYHDTKILLVANCLLDIER